MSQEKVVILLVPTFVHIGVMQSGQMVRSRSHQLDPEVWQHACEDNLRPVSRWLRSSVESLNCAGASANMFYAGLTETVEVFSCPLHGYRLRNAAHLALSELISHSLQDNPHAIQRICTDSTHAEGEARLSHMLLLSEQESAAKMLGDCVRDAGLSLELIAPIEGPLLLQTARTAVQQSAERTTLVLRVGEHCGILAAARGGRLRLLHRTGLSLDSLVEALTRPIHMRDRSDETSIALTAEEARSMLLAHGLPAPETVMEEFRGLTGRDVLPVLQPVLQRSVVQMKQSLRFELSEEERRDAVLMLTGIGQHIPRLIDTLAAHADVDLQSRVISPRDSAVELNRDSDLLTALNVDEWDADLGSLAEHRSSLMRRAKVMLAIGTACSLALVGAQSIPPIVSLNAAKSQRAKLAPHLASATAIETRVESARQFREQIDSLRLLLWKGLGVAIPWNAMLRELEQLTPDNIKLLDLSYHSTDQDGVLTMSGFARPTNDDAAGGLSAYMDRISVSPLVESVRLGSTSRADDNDGQMIQFSATIKLVAVPANLDQALGDQE